MPLASQRGFQRLDRHAAGYGRTVAASLADFAVDEHAFVGLGPLPAFAQAPPFGGAGLVEQQHRNARVLAQLFLQEDVFLPRVDAGIGREVPLRILRRFVAHQADPADTFRVQLLDHLRDADFAIDGLAAGHGYESVVKQLVGDRDVGRNRGPYRENPGMEIGAVSHVSEHVFFIGKRRLPDPHRALATHLRKETGLDRVDQYRHRMAADAAQCARAVDHLGRASMRAARAVGRQPGGDLFDRGG